ncbi:extracellular solute-binding protein [Paenibacillus sp. LMG 31456]|uniref:Extracellular solute-binding protein n=1 Tax=Paenibacillus foliorum TaxID=2654974 RepID=A0A972GU58_9BACL|nr:sugar ABC transporter substrate-binding protein [Paenibacillus foliorum]NOU96388.1 extracellular solute-binding protein [Paenibacillus foliorum]
MKMKKTMVFTAGLSFVLAMTGCGGGGGAVKNEAGAEVKSAKKDELVKLTFWDDNAGPNRTPFYEEIFKRFEAKNPNIKVEYVGVPSASAKQKFDVAISSNDMPDVGGVSNRFIADFAAKGALLALDPYYDKWDEKSKMVSSVIDFNRSLVPDKKLYQLPNTLFMDVFWYRTDLFKDAGLKPPGTWEDFFTAAEKLTAPDKKQYGYSVRGGVGSINQLTTALYSYSGITNYFDEKGKATANDPKHIEFLKKYVGLYKKYTPTSDITNGYKEMVATFDNGTAAMIQHNFGSYNDHLNTLGAAKVAAVLLPKAANGNRVVISEPNGYSVFKSTKHPEESFKLVSFLASSDIQTYWNQNIGQMPTNQESMKSDYVKNAQHILAGSEVLLDKDTSILKVPVYLPDYAGIITQQLEPNFQKVLSGAMTAEDFLNGWAKAMEKSNEEYNKMMKK